MLQLLLARRLERVDLAALRIDARHHVLDDAVLAGGIHALQHDEHRPAVLRVKPLLQPGEPADAVGEHRLDVILVDGQAEGFRRIVAGKPQAARLVDPAMFEDFGELHRRLTCIVTSFNVATSVEETQ